MFGQQECGLYREPSGSCDSVVLIPKQKLVFDLLNYFYAKDSNTSSYLLHGNAYNAAVKKQVNV